MTPQRILFLAEGQVGDLLLLTPALRATKETFPQASVSVLVVERRNAEGTKSSDNLAASPAERKASALGTNSNVDELLILNRQLLRAQRGGARVRAEGTVVGELRRRNFDTVVCTFPEDRFVLWAFASGARLRVGQRRQGLRWLLNCTPDIEKSVRGVREYYSDLVRALGADVRSNHTEYTLRSDAVAWATRFLEQKNVPTGKPIVAVHPGASGNYKIWPPDRYAALIDNLSGKGVAVLLLHGDMDLPVVRLIHGQLRSPCIMVPTGRDIGNLAALISRCDLCISNDSGPRHLAVAVGCPSLAFFRQHHDREWGVYAESPSCMTLKSRSKCPACPANVCLDTTPEGEQFGSWCLREIGVDEAIHAAETMLSK